MNARTLPQHLSARDVCAKLRMQDLDAANAMHAAHTETVQTCISMRCIPQVNEADHTPPSQERKMEATGTKVTINAERLAQINELSSGAHDSISEGMCVMEAVSYIAGEPWSDAPQCACPVITAFCVSWNDSLSDADRTRILKPLIPRIVGTRSTKDVEERRSYMALDWLIRVFTPKWLDLVPSLHDHAKQLRDLDSIADMAGAEAAGVKVRAARSAARDAAWDAAWDAARAAAWDAAWDAARDAAWDAARSAAGAAAWDAAWDAARDAAWDAAWDAAGDAAGDAAWDAARAAARDAARDAAGDALRPTTEWLQASALALVDQMIEVAA